MPGSHGRSPREIRRDHLEEEIRQGEEQLRQDRGSDSADEHLSHPQARLLVMVGALGIVGTGHVVALLLQILLKAQPLPVTMKDPGIEVVRAAQKGFQSLGDWARPTAFALGFLLLLACVVQVSFQNDERSARRRVDWRGWALALGLIVVPFFDFNTAGDEIGLPTGIGIACGLGWISLGVCRSDTLREVFSFFHRPWFGIAMGVAAAGLITGGLVMNAPAFSLLGVLVASCFSLQLMQVGWEKSAKLRKWEQEEARLAQMRIELEKLQKEEAFEQELREFEQWRDEERP